MKKEVKIEVKSETAHQCFGKNSVVNLYQQCMTSHIIRWENSNVKENHQKGSEI